MIDRTLACAFVGAQDHLTSHREQREQTPTSNGRSNPIGQNRQSLYLHNTRNSLSHANHSSDRSDATNNFIHDTEPNNVENRTVVGDNMRTRQNGNMPPPICLQITNIAGGNNYSAITGSTNIAGGNNYSAIGGHNNNNHRLGTGSFNMVGCRNSNFCVDNDNIDGNNSNIAGGSRSNYSAARDNIDQQHNDRRDNNHGMNNPVRNYTADFNIVDGNNNNIVARNRNTGGCSNNIAGGSHNSACHNYLESGNPNENDDETGNENSIDPTGVSANDQSHVGRVGSENGILLTS